MSTDTVVIGCKIPTGLKLELGKPGNSNYQTYTVKGPNTNSPQDVAAGAGLTEVPKEFWTEWEKKHKWLPAYKAKHVFMQEDRASTQAQAIELSAERTGLEPLDPNKAPRGIEVDATHVANAKREAIHRRVGE